MFAKAASSATTTAISPHATINTVDPAVNRDGGTTRRTDQLLGHADLQTRHDTTAVRHATGRWSGGARRHATPRDGERTQAARAHVPSWCSPRAFVFFLCACKCVVGGGSDARWCAARRSLVQCLSAAAAICPSRARLASAKQIVLRRHPEGGTPHRLEDEPERNRSRQAPQQMCRDACFEVCCQNVQSVIFDVFRRQ